MTRILVVDDSVLMRQMIRVTLSSAGYQVLEATDGHEALELASRYGVVDLVITDVNMPNVDGLSLVRELRRRREYQNVPILILTTDSSASAKPKAKTEGASGWITKPFNSDKLLSTLTRLLN